MASDERTTRIVCAYTKRLVYALVNIVTIIVTCIYISHAFNHYKVIKENAPTLKTPFGQFDLQNTKVAWIFATARVIFLTFTTFFSAAVPEACIFIFSVLALVFEIPMACVAESNYGYLVSFAQLDLSPSNPSCAQANMTMPQWNFYSSYGSIVGKPTRDICQEFVHEGDLLRASLLFSWFTLWILLFIVAFFCAMTNGKEASCWDLIVHFVGFETSGWWTAFKGCFSMPRCGRRRSHNTSESSTLADEFIEEKAAQKV